MKKIMQILLLAALLSACINPQQIKDYSDKEARSLKILDSISKLQAKLDTSLKELNAIYEERQNAILFNNLNIPK